MEAVPVDGSSAVGVVEFRQIFPQVANHIAAGDQAHADIPGCQAVGFHGTLVHDALASVIIVESFQGTVDLVAPGLVNEDLCVRAGLFDLLIKIRQIGLIGAVITALGTCLLQGDYIPLFQLQRIIHGNLADTFAVDLQIIVLRLTDKVVPVPFQRTAADVQIYCINIFAAALGDPGKPLLGILRKAVADTENFQSQHSVSG